MNIVITLPRVLIDAIISGRKSVEIRHSVPEHFNQDEDVVIVVEKGTKNIPILFSIMQLKIYRDTSLVVSNYTEDAAVPQEWLANYCLKSRKVCVWEIGRVCRLRNPTDMASCIGLKNNPQAFVYNNFDVAQITLGYSFWSRCVRGEAKSYVYAPDKRNKIIREYLTTDCEVDFLQWCEVNKIPFNWRGMQLK